MERKRYVYEVLDMAITAKKNCMKSAVISPEWESKWDDLIEHLQKKYLPHGSGFDCGTVVIEEECVNGLRLVLNFDYHHMDEYGYYDGWSSHKAVVVPYFDGIGVTIKGALPRKYRHSKEYFGDTIHYSLTKEIDQEEIDNILNVKRS